MLLQIQPSPPPRCAYWLGRRQTSTQPPRLLRRAGLCSPKTPRRRCGLPWLACLPRACAAPGPPARSGPFPEAGGGADPRGRRLSAPSLRATGLSRPGRSGARGETWRAGGEAGGVPRCPGRAVRRCGGGPGWGAAAPVRRQVEVHGGPGTLTIHLCSIDS